MDSDLEGEDTFEVEQFQECDNHKSDVAVNSNKNPTMAPASSQLSLSTITMTSNIDRLLNLIVITKHIKIDRYIDGIKCEGVGSSGNIPVGKKKRSKTVDPSVIKAKVSKKKSKLDFFNQCTIYVYPDESRAKPLNIKLFNNGQMVLTGVKNNVEYNPAIEHIVSGINDIPSSQVEYNVLSELELDDKELQDYLDNNLDALNSILKYILTSAKHITYLSHLDLGKLGAVLDEVTQKNNLKKKIRKHKVTHADQVSPVIPIFDSVIEKELLILIKIYQICLTYITQGDLLNINNSLSPDDWLFTKFLPILDHILNNYNTNDRTIKVVLPAFIRKFEGDKIVYNSINSKIAMINSFFNANFQINRVTVQQLLVTKYNISADYNPDKYQGVNAKVVSSATCKAGIHEYSSGMSALQKSDHTSGMSELQKSEPRCTCCELSIFIFRKGTIIITGAKDWLQIVDVAKQIQKILDIEYPNIVQKTIIKKAKVSNLPDKVIMNGSVYLRRGYIRNNPKNYFLIKEFGLPIWETKDGSH